ncbi:CMRF35-like molecule 9 [Etheostoma cragini]|uniref:CMRF35-like molecule 9 n=1 Tax=Etheostoma cragini TaxID=417921 RepID=UPI00155F2185|nr:CMRF35-like molecule 9 [Etheostoma cragini]
MMIPHVVVFCCFAVVCAEVSEVLEVSGHVGGEVSIHCSGSWTTNNSSEHYYMYFCKGVCSRDSSLIQPARKRLAGARQGRYSMEVNRGDGAFKVTIKRLKRVDAGRYCCGVEKTFDVLRQEVNLIVVETSTVPHQSPPSTTTLQTKAETLPQGSFPSSTKPSPAAATHLKDTIVVIIVSVSLALLVCAIIPLIFYGNCRRNSEGQNKGESDYCEEHAEVAPAPAAVRLRSVEPGTDPESSVQDASQFAAVYQALDSKSLD